MSKLQITLIIMAFGTCVLLFNLPRGVIKKEKELPSQTASKTTPLPAGSEEMHRPIVSGKDLSSIENLRKEYFIVSNKEKKITFADSLASVFRKLQQYDSSAKYVAEGAKLDPTIQRLEKAGDSFTEANALAPESSKTKYNEQARAFYASVLKEDPKNLEVKSKLALTYIGGEATMQGVQILREVLKEDPKNETAIFNLGILSLQSGQNKKAIDRFKDLIKINPGNANAHFYLGVSFLNSGEKQKARIAFKAAQALENDPAFQSTVATYLQEVDK